MKKFIRIIAAVMAAATIAVTASVSASANLGCTANDSQFLNDIGLCPDRWGCIYTAFHWGEVSKAVDAAWAKAGVTSVTSPDDFNDYYINGEWVDRRMAIQYAADSLGKNIDVKKYSPDRNPASPTAD